MVRAGRRFVCNAATAHKPSKVETSSSQNQKTCLHYACGVDALRAARWLVSRGADIEARTGVSQSCSAVSDVFLPIPGTGLILSSSLHSELERTQHGHTCLLTACLWGSIDVAEFLVLHGADTSAKSFPTVRMVRPSCGASPRVLGVLRLSDSIRSVVSRSSLVDSQAARRMCQCW